MNFFAASASAEEEITSVTETSVPEVIDAAQEVIDAVAERNMDTSVLEHFGKSLLNYIPTVIIAVIIFLVGKLIAKLIIKIIDRAVGRSHIDKTAQNFLTSLLNTVFTAIVLVISLSALGIPMTSIITVIGAAGVAIGLALQSSLSNVAGGFIILFTKPFVKGDYIAVSGVEGSVHSISILSTQIVTVDNKVIYIPNGQVSTSTIINYSREAKRMVERKFSVSYSSDTEKVKSVIKQVIAQNEKIRHSDPVLVRMFSLDDSAVTFIVRVWTDTANYWDVWYDLAEEVKDAFDREGIEIPFPQIVVHS